jgi:hypothetical protein
MAKLKLIELAHARSGDKGNSSNIGVIARNAEYYPIICRELSAERVRQHFKGICFGEVLRYDLPNIHALNFVLKDSLDGGGTVSLRSDAQGKTHAATLLMMEIEVQDLP